MSDLNDTGKELDNTLYSTRGETWLCGDGPWKIRYSNGSGSMGHNLLGVMESLDLMPELGPTEFIITRNMEPTNLSEMETILCKEGLSLVDGRFVRFSIPESSFKELIDGEWTEPITEVLWTEVWDNPCWDIFKERRRDFRRKLKSL